MSTFTPLLPPFTATPRTDVDALVNRVFCMDALELLALLPDASVDAFILDYPYGVTQNFWDVPIPFAPMWAGVKRTLKPRGVFVTTAAQPFTSMLTMSNPSWFHEELVWDKRLSTGFLDANRKHLKRHENVLVFCDGLPTYNPQMRKGVFRKKGGINRQAEHYGDYHDAISWNDEYYPTTIIEFPNTDRSNTVHPTQKPVALYEYLISTYTRPNDLVLDFCCGSGTTGVAARNLKRRYILNDKEPEYVAIARDRLRNAWDKPRYRESDLTGLPLFDQAASE